MRAATLLWFRNDLRLADNPALGAATRRGGPIIPLFIWAPDEEGDWPPGSASCWWLHHSLLALNDQLNRLGLRMVLRRGPTLTALEALLKGTGATAVFWNRRYEPAMVRRDRSIETALRAEGIEARSFNATLLHEPWTIQNQQGKPFRVFTAFWKRCLAAPKPAAPLPPPRKLIRPAKWPESLALEDLQLEPALDWAVGIRAAWRPGETGARQQLARFLKNAYSHYSEVRDRPDFEATSRLSPHLHFGEIGPRQIWNALANEAARNKKAGMGWCHSRFVTELGWREFSYHLLYHFPQTPGEPLRPAFKRFPWRRNVEWLRAWHRGRTGYPLVDAGMRELWTTGWMHNRVRMVTASFLVKDLLLPWQEGARWFWDTLVDADLAQNTLGWQWVAGCGADAAPFFRIFNPASQGEKFDPKGDYIRRWCPELGRLPDKHIHDPGRAPAEILTGAGVELGRTYPRPIVSHTIAREVALEAFEKLKGVK